jgi:hypothetical protein
MPRNNPGRSLARKQNLPPTRNSFLLKLLQGETFLDRENLLHNYKFLQPLCGAGFSEFYDTARLWFSILRKPEIHGYKIVTAKWLKLIQLKEYSQRHYPRRG